MHSRCRGDNKRRKESFSFSSIGHCRRWSSTRSHPNDKKVDKKWFLDVVINAHLENSGVGDLHTCNLENSLPDAVAKVITPLLSTQLYCRCATDVSWPPERPSSTQRRLRWSPVLRSQMWIVSENDGASSLTYCLTRKLWLFYHQRDKQRKSRLGPGNLHRPTSRTCLMCRLHPYEEVCRSTPFCRRNSIGTCLHPDRTISFYRNTITQAPVHRKSICKYVCTNG